MTTSADILRSYRAASSRFKLKSTGWLQILLIASHGEEGCSAVSLYRGPLRSSRNITHETFRRWEALGLVSLSKRYKDQRPKPFLWVTITPAALELLKLSK